MAEGDYTLPVPTTAEKTAMVGQLAVLDAARAGVGMDVIGTLYPRKRAVARAILEALVTEGRITKSVRGKAPGTQIYTLIDTP